MIFTGAPCRAGSELLGAAAARRHEVEFYIVLLEPAELGGDVLRPLCRPVRNHPGGDLGLRARGAGRQRGRERQGQQQGQCSAPMQALRDRQHHDLHPPPATLQPQLGAG
jgi:hypothetical protein